MRAILAAWDKTGLPELGRTLVELGWEVMSSGRSLTTLHDAGVAALAVSDVIGLSSMLGGRVKTLHPAIHAAILADRSQTDHMDELADAGIVPIDLVVTNFYPFETRRSTDMIDVGGPAMVRAAAKNHHHVGVVVDPSDYAEVARELASGGLTLGTRRRLARKAYAYTAAYDGAIVRWFDDQPEVPAAARAFPDTIHLTMVKTDDLRLGENPHQRAARYRLDDATGWWDTAVQHHGAAMSYLNLFDADAAWRLAHGLGPPGRPAAVVVKHGNPCGVAQDDDVASAWQRAHAGDPDSAFGGIVAVNGTVTLALAEQLSSTYTLVVVAPDYEADALAVLRRKRDLRVVQADAPSTGTRHLRHVDGGILLQDQDSLSLDPNGALDRSGWSVVTRRAPTGDEWRDLELAWRIVARTNSNAVVLVKDDQAVGIGVSPQNRRDAAGVAADKAAGRARGGSCASDGFFPFRDGLEAVVEAGCTAIVQPGGSVRDDDVIAAADEAGLAMVLTGTRRFRH